MVLMHKYIFFEKTMFKDIPISLIPNDDNLKTDYIIFDDENHTCVCVCHDKRFVYNYLNQILHHDKLIHHGCLICPSTMITNMSVYNESNKHITKEFFNNDRIVINIVRIYHVYKVSPIKKGCMVVYFGDDLYVDDVIVECLDNEGIYKRINYDDFLFAIDYYNNISPNNHNGFNIVEYGNNHNCYIINNNKHQPSMMVGKSPRKTYMLINIDTKLYDLHKLASMFNDYMQEFANKYALVNIYHAATCHNNDIFKLKNKEAITIINMCLDKLTSSF